MKNQITYNYGQWLRCLETIEHRIKTETPEISDELLLAGLFGGTEFQGTNFSINFQEFRKLVQEAFKDTQVAHGCQIDSSWEGSFFKRLWGRIKHLRNLKMEVLRQKQLEQIVYLKEQSIGKT